MEEFIASIYQYVYIIIVALFTIPVIKSYKWKNGLYDYKRPDNLKRDVFVVILLILIFGFRPVSQKYFVDMIGYDYQLSELAGSPFTFTWITDNKIFDNLLNFWGSHRLGNTNFFLFMAAIYFGCSYIGIRRLFPTHTMPAYLVFLAAFSTFGFATNGIKAGAATSIFIMALGYLDKKWICLPLAIISFGFHHSMELPVAALILTMFYKSPKWYFYGWFVCLVLAMLHVTYFQELFGGMTDEQGAGYLIVKEDETVGGIRFRPDFILYSAAPVWIGYQFEMKMKQTSKIYSTLLHFYLCCNGIWMLCMYASFNNRIAYLSWFVYPLIIIYPFLYVDTREQRYRYFSKTVMYHLCFTLLMEFVYYGIFQLGH